MPGAHRPDSLNWLMAGKIVNRVLPALVALTALLLASSASAAPTTGVQSQTIVALPIPDTTLGQGPSGAFAAADPSRLPISFAVSGPCTAGVPYVAIDITSGGSIAGVTNPKAYGSQINPIAPGVCSVTASQPGNDTYAAAPDVTMSFTILPGPPMPQTRITRAPSGKPQPHRHKRRGHRWVFSFTDAAPGVAFSCSLDDGQFNPCSSPFVRRHRLERGIHVFQVKSIDSHLNESAPSITVFRVGGRAR
jgi:hypothetical protein